MALRTYVLTPNFTTEPNGPLRLGSIIGRPDRPTKQLVPPTAVLDTITHSQHDNKFYRTTASSASGNIWSQFLQFASAGAGFEASRALSTNFDMESLDTIYLKQDPTDADAARISEMPIVRTEMKKGIFGSSPVYMITGLKVAKGFKMTVTTARSLGLHANAEAPITEEVSLGAEASVSREKSLEESFTSGTDIIIAYQLHVIDRKGWRRSPSADLFVPAAGFLSEGHERKKEEVEIGPASVEDWKMLMPTYGVQVETVQVTEPEGVCFCVVPKPRPGK